MISRLKPWQLGAVLAAICGIVIGILEWRSTAVTRSPSYLLGTLPLNGAVSGYLDVAKLRSSGVLEELVGKEANEDADYRAFAEQIGFNYRTDLNGIAASYSNGGLYATMRGRFNWPKLNAYAVAQKGECTNGLCSMPASRPHQSISFTMLSADILAWAVTDQPLGVERIGFGKGTGQSDAVGPSAVLWISAPGSSFRDPSSVPTGTRAFLEPLSAAQSASFSLEPAKSGKFEVHMQAPCASADVAAQLAKVLNQTTDVLRSVIVHEKLAPDKGSLSGVLVSGRFETRAASVDGLWPIDSAVIQSLISGDVR